MDNVNENKGLDKLALLAILAISIAIAGLIVMLKTRTPMTSPITLKHINLSASVPIDKGWQSRKEWVFIDNGFTLSSIYKTTSQRTTAMAQCRYQTLRIQNPAEMQMKQKAFSLKDKITQQGQILANSLNFDWVMIGSHTFYAVSNLPNNRLIEVEVRQIVNEPDWARKIFFDIIETIKYDNTSFEAANQLVSDLKKIRPAKLINEKKQKNYFLISDQQKKPLGFTAETYLKSSPDIAMNLRAATFFYIRNNNLSNEQVTFFQGNDTFDNFYWKSETNSLRGKKSIEIVVEEPSLMTVTAFSREVIVENYQLSPAAVPDIFMNQLLELFIVSKFDEVTVDIIEAEGIVTPALLTKIKPANESTDFLVRIAYLNGSEFFEEVHFDRQRQITKRMIHQTSIFVIEKTNEKQITDLFPERINYFNEGQILEENKI